MEPITLEQAHTEIRGIARVCRGPLSEDAATVKDALLADGRLEEAAEEDKAGRAGCGADFNDIVCAGPLDGKLHPYECPKCGVTGEYRAPFYELAD